jgi:hypothetical protein
MKRRDFLKKSSVAIGLAGSLDLLPSLMAGESDPPNPSGQTGASPEDNRSADYFRRAQQDKFLPKPPVFADSFRPDDVRISPMPLAERVKRKIVPRRSVRKQDITLIARHGIESVSASSRALAAKPQSGKATCDLHLPEGKPVEVHLKLGRRDPLDWVNWVA